MHSSGKTANWQPCRAACRMAAVMAWTLKSTSATRSSGDTTATRTKPNAAGVNSEKGTMHIPFWPVPHRRGLAANTAGAEPAGAKHRDK